MIAATPDETLSKVLQRALADERIAQAADTALIFQDISALESRLSDLQAQFPPDTLHAAAIKANPLLRLLRRVVAMGCGLEAASLPELHLAVHAGADPAMIVFDSPAKTADELVFALTLGCHVNADSIDELDRIARIRNTGGVPDRGSVGVRINPQVGTGKIAMTSVAAHYSKFGVPLLDCREELLDRFLRYDWMTGVHVHIGSQGCSPQMLLDGVGRVFDFVDDANSAMKSAGLDRRVSVFDLGGGLPVSYHRNVAPYSMEQYASQLRETFPQLFDGSLRLITEFGRYLYANTGWVASRVEYVKRGSPISTAMVHVGADLFLRKCYTPGDWHHDIFVADSRGEIKPEETLETYAIAGPLCFAGDLLEREVTLPRIEEGDYIVIRDTGAYTLGMWSRYNSRQIPKVVGYRNDGSEMTILKEREPIERIIEFWS
ncbi:MAG TPA: diaminopimelate decarboxylase [Thermoanaerobaculia bacterium]|nr:diaminopimelate decarboxylase [Thermoanaerobaculia bacterium]